MRTPFLSSAWPPRLLTLGLWALAVGSAAFWLLQLPSQQPPAEADVAQAALLADAQGLNQLLGADAAEPQAAPDEPPPPAAQYQLVGVLAGARSGHGAALIAVNGQPAKHYRVGALLDGGENLYLQSVSGRSAQLGPSRGGAAQLQLQLPEFAPAQRPAAASSLYAAPTTQPITNNLPPRHSPRSTQQHVPMPPGG